jgi:hypothetical protein
VYKESKTLEAKFQSICHPDPRLNRSIALMRTRNGTKCTRGNERSKKKPFVVNIGVDQCPTRENLQVTGRHFFFCEYTNNDLERKGVKLQPTAKRTQADAIVQTPFVHQKLPNSDYSHCPAKILKLFPLKESVFNAYQRNIGVGYLMEKNLYPIHARCSFNLSVSIHSSS